MGPLAAIPFLLLAVGNGPIVGIGGLTPTSGSWVAALSEDGSTVVGHSSTGAGFAAVRWTAAAGLQRVHPPGWIYESYCSDVSADGAIVTGFGSDGFGGFYGFVWDAASGLAAPLASMPAGTFSTTRAVSDDGSLVMGLASDAQGKLRQVAWLVGSDTPIVVASLLPGAAIDARALRRTGTGTFTWVGTAWSDTGSYAVPVRHGASQALERVPLGPGPFGKAIAYDGSRDGIVVGSQALTGTDTRAYASTPQGGIQLLETPAGWSSIALAISPDGQRIVGYYHQGITQKPVIWDEQPNGTYRARDPVPMIGPAAATEWTLFAIVDVSGDRGTIAGIGQDLTAGVIRGWVARVPPQ